MGKQGQGAAARACTPSAFFWRRVTIPSCSIFFSSLACRPFRVSCSSLRPLSSAPFVVLAALCPSRFPFPLICSFLPTCAPCLYHAPLAPLHAHFPSCVLCATRGGCGAVVAGGAIFQKTKKLNKKSRVCFRSFAFQNTTTKQNNNKRRAAPPRLTYFRISSPKLPPITTRARPFLWDFCETNVSRNSFHLQFFVFDKKNGKPLFIALLDKKNRGPTLL